MTERETPDGETLTPAEALAAVSNETRVAGTTGTESEAEVGEYNGCYTFRQAFSRRRPHNQL